ncbi:hypothetical protein SSX86_006878 [Deinandra increscens subsp. villosa]|uniref:Glycosyltransferase n=1 Tax=Deinandra increscens subsp. villosa TaxID=3103831 RepID=A0AAP0H6Y8_9ASTR
MEKQAHIAIVPSPGMGHLIPLLEFAKSLSSKYNISSTFIIPNDAPLSTSRLQFLDSLPNSINYTLLPPVNLNDLPPDTRIETRICLTMTRSIASLRETIGSMVAENNMVALFADLFGTDAFDVAIEFGIPHYLFFPASAMTLSLMLHLPEIDRAVSGPYKDAPDPIRMPGCLPVHGKDLPDPFEDRENDAYKHVLHIAKGYRMAKGIVVNSFKELEGGVIEALQQGQPGKPLVYPVGPLIRTGSVEPSKDVNELSCLNWLDSQPRGSVLYICFGSGGALTFEQVTELAMGLELSEQRFIWVVRTPKDKVAGTTYLDTKDHDENFYFLPKMFMKRTKNHGLVVPNWAPQDQILRHSSTGGFLTHCGWNSILETIYQGVPMIVWPLYAEQKMNSIMLTDGLKLAMRAKLNEKGIVDRIEVFRVVKALMEGEEGKMIRIRSQELKGSVTSVLSENGSSSRTLDQLASKLKKEI